MHMAADVMIARGSDREVFAEADVSVHRRVVEMKRCEAWRTLDVQPASARYCVTCVVLPDPVSADRMMIWLSLTPCRICSRKGKMGSPMRCSLIGRESWNPNITAFPRAFSFHSGCANVDDRAMVPRRSSARCLDHASVLQAGFIHLAQI